MNALCEPFGHLRLIAPSGAAAVLFCLTITLCSNVFPQSGQIAQPDNDTLVIENSPELNVLAFRKTVIIRSNAKEVFSWGGDVVVEGRVEGDVAALGGNVVQRETGYIGGAVIVIGGAYKPDVPKPARGEGSETVVFGMFEEEFRGLAQDPSQIFAPAVSTAFLIQRILSVLFWFLVTLIVATLAPGAVSRSVAEVKTNALKIFGYGSAGLVLTLLLVVIGLHFFPDHLGAVVSLMALVLLFLAYGFGRVILQVLLGRWVVRRTLGGTRTSDALAIFAGTFGLTLLLSVPYVWPFCVFALFAVGIGLVTRARRRSGNSVLNST